MEDTRPNLKEHYRVGKKKKTCLRSQIITLTRSNDDDTSRKHPFLSEMSYLMRKINKTNFPFGV